MYVLPRASFVCKFDQSHVKPTLRVRARVTDSTQLSRASIAMIETKQLAYDIQTSRHLTLRSSPPPPTFPFLTCPRPAGNLSLRIEAFVFNSSLQETSPISHVAKANFVSSCKNETQGTRSSIRTLIVQRYESRVTRLVDYTQHLR